MSCQLPHRYNISFESLPDDQGGNGRHKCAGCAYNRGYQAGINLQDNVTLDLNTLPDSQAGTVRHKSPHASFAQGYLDGVNAFYNQN